MPRKNCSVCESLARAEDLARGSKDSLQNILIAAKTLNTPEGQDLLHTAEKLIGKAIQYRQEHESTCEQT